MPATSLPQSPSREGILRFLEGKVARWWMPDDVVFVQGGSVCALAQAAADCLAGRSLAWAEACVVAQLLHEFAGCCFALACRPP